MGYSYNMRRLRLEPHTHLFPGFSQRGVDNGFTGLEVPADRSVKPVEPARVGAAREEHVPLTHQKNVCHDRKPHP